MTALPAGSVEVDPAIPVTLDPINAAEVRARAAGLRVALLSDAIPGRNGVGTYYDDLQANLGDHLSAVRLFAPPTEPGAEFRGLSMRMPGDPTQRLFMPSPSHLFDELRAFNPHVVISATPWLYGTLSISMAHRLGAAVCIGYHTQIDKLLGMYWDRIGLGGLARTVVSWWDRLLFRFGEIVLVHNEALIAAARSAGARDVALVGTPVPKPFLEAPCAPPPTRVDRVVFVGRLAPEKEIGQILEAAADHPAVQFVLVGEGPLRAEVDAAAAALPNLRVTGWLSRDEVQAHVDWADIIVLPSRYETFGSAAFEAMIRGRPALISPNCGLANWSELQPGIVVMDEGQRLTGALAEMRSMGPEAITALAARARLGARQLSERTVDHWLAVLVRAADLAERERTLPGDRVSG